MSHSLFQRKVFLILFCLITSFNAKAQLRQIYTDHQGDYDQVIGISFYSNTQGYVAFNNYIGFTSDSGHTFTKKTVTNINYNGYTGVNILFGFAYSGIKAFDQNNIILYGHFGFVPAILRSVNGGDSYTLVYHSQYDPSQLSTGIMDMIFPENSFTGYAVDADRILRTTNGGFNWTPVYIAPNSCFDKLEATNDLEVYALSDNSLDNILFPNGRIFDPNKIIYTKTGGSGWQKLNVPTGNIYSVNFYSTDKAYLNIDDKIFYSDNNGMNWIQKNDVEYNGVGFEQMKFFNDSTGYGIGFSRYKTTDSGKIWEKIPVDNPDIDQNYLQSSCFRSKDLFWAGGYKDNLIAITTNGGGNTIPRAFFTIDLTEVSANNLYKFNNHSNPRYTYKWFKNSVLFSTDYNASYVSPRLYIDTVKLVVINGNFSDTSSMIVDTRKNTAPCTAAFTIASPDTSAVKFTGQDSAFGTKHYWYWGDGTVDSSSRILTHHYKVVGTYTIKHTVYNTISRCIDSLTKTVTIDRLKNCLLLSITNQADTFYTNKITFNYNFERTSESYPSYWVIDTVFWNFGDGKTYKQTGSSPFVYTYDSSKYYNVCITVKNKITGCVATVCKPIFVFLEPGCNASFIRSGNSTYLPLTFIGRLNANNKGKRNTWIFDNKDTVKTGNTNQVLKKYFATEVNSYWNEYSYGGCRSIALIDIDNIKNRTVKHIQYDSLTQCSDTVVSVFTPSTAVSGPRIEVIQSNIFPNLFTYKFYYDSIKPYGSRYGVQDVGSSYFACGYNYSCTSAEYIYVRPGNVSVGIASGCIGNSDYREVYMKYHTVTNLDTCLIYPPKFSYSADTTSPLKISFYDSSWFYNNAKFYPSPLHTIYFGDGDSLKQSSSNFSHIYKRPGIYTVILKYYQTTGCSKTYSAQVNIPSQICVNGNTGLRSDRAGNAYQWQVNTGSGFTNILNGINYSGANTDSLTITNFISSWNGYTYRCMVDGSSSRLFKILIANTWTGAINNEWANPGNWNCGVIPDANTYVIINSGTVNVNSNTTIKGLELAPDAHLNIQAPTTLTITN
ncbi:PKD domain-containing protein [Ferruginibacter lapsinanis]|uniref:PKD domain-containing protein n=1 Tax=Ferruginibacter lapsinanis TaxID=563172 RepID=UPI001E2BFE6C|nr:PKD domain-containing protein [Ferruginibacter lapsinanis]UEG49638.1 PKD domain-containing protein [Ferruginibacter lapsinanis]